MDYSSAMGLRIGVCGAGLFASSFIPLFQAHPMVDEVCLAEVFPERRVEQAARFGVPRTFAGVSSVHPVHRLPKEFAGLRNGHQGSHQFLACDFIEAITEKKLPPVHVWAAARYCLPGIVAHESAKRGGELLEIPDFGDPTKIASQV